MSDEARVLVIYTGYVVPGFSGFLGNSPARRSRLRLQAIDLNFSSSQRYDRDAKKRRGRIRTSPRISREQVRINRFPRLHDWVFPIVEPSASFSNIALLTLFRRNPFPCSVRIRTTFCSHCRSNSNVACDPSRGECFVCTFATKALRLLR